MHRPLEHSNATAPRMKAGIDVLVCGSCKLQADRQWHTRYAFAEVEQRPRAGDSASKAQLLHETIL